eukprot:jgi/Mesvir1/19695/Mv09960-RA.1
MATPASQIYRLAGKIMHVGMYTPPSGRNLHAYHIIVVDKNGKAHTVIANVDDFRRQNGLDVGKETFPVGQHAQFVTNTRTPCTWSASGFTLHLRNGNNMRLVDTPIDGGNFTMPFDFTPFKALEKKIPVANGHVKASVDVFGLVNAIYRPKASAKTSRTRIILADSSTAATAATISVILFDDAQQAVVDNAHAGATLVIAIKGAKLGYYQGNVTLAAGNTAYVTTSDVVGGDAATLKADALKDDKYKGIAIVDESPVMSLVDISAKAWSDLKAGSFSATCEAQLTPAEHYNDPKRCIYYGCVQKARSSNRTCRKALVDGVCTDHPGVHQKGSPFFHGGCYIRDPNHFIKVSLFTDGVSSMLRDPPVTPTEWLDMDPKERAQLWENFFSSNRWTNLHLRVRPAQFASAAPGSKEGPQYLLVAKDYFFPDLDKQAQDIKWDDFDWSSV